MANAPRGFTQAITDAAEYYTMLFSNDEVINIHVGYGEIDGSPMAPNALGESESYGYLTNYSTVTNALAQDGYSFSATNEPTSSQFFVTSADAKTLGLINPTSSAVDGYIGFSNLNGTGYSWNETASVSGSTSGTGSSQFDLEAVAFHEISEVMGRIDMEGELVNGKPTVYAARSLQLPEPWRSRTFRERGQLLRQRRNDAIWAPTTMRRPTAATSPTGRRSRRRRSRTRQGCPAASMFLMPTMHLRFQATMAISRAATSSRMPLSAMG